VLPDLPDDGAGRDTPLRLTLLQALARLPAKDRAVVVLRYWEDRSIEETAQVMNASSAAVRTRCVRALGRLRELLGEDLSEYARP
jgi:RNA polymerase sigma factor (sigma-70 family)